MDTEQGLRAKFLKAIDSDPPLTKLWKFRALIQNYPKEAATLKDKMLEYAIKNEFIGEFEQIYKLCGVPQSNIPRSGEYGRLKDKLIPIINTVKIEA